MVLIVTVPGHCLSLTLHSVFAQMPHYKLLIENFKHISASEYDFHRWASA